MKPVSLIKVYTTKFSYSLFLLKIKENLMSIEKIFCNESQKSLSQYLFFEVSLFRFQFLPAIKYWDCYYNEYPVKQIVSLYLKLPFKPVFFKVLFYFWKDRSLFIRLILNLSISENLDQIPL